LSIDDYGTKTSQIVGVTLLIYQAFLVNMTSN